MLKRRSTHHPFVLAVISFLLLGALSACSESAASGAAAPPPPALPVVTLAQKPATIYQEYSASLEGKKDIEIRPQVEGYIEAIYVDEGARVRKGQSLFRINDRPYREQLNSARAGLSTAQANLAAARINVNKLKPLVQSGIISDVQLQSALAAQTAASAQVAQAAAQVQSAQINLGFTLIKAPADGYIGRLPMKTGSLVGMATPEPLTVLSELSSVYAYFSLSEADFIRFREQYKGASLEEKIASMAPVELVLADGTVYPQKGKVELASGQFNSTIGSISFRAAFPNAAGTLRSGNTGKIRLPLSLSSPVIVPQEATFEMQDKLFVFTLGDSSKVSTVPIKPAGKSGNYYLVQEGVKAGDRIVFSGLDRLRDGAVIEPQAISLDSLLTKNPL